jgi:hypothetical protein
VHADLLETYCTELYVRGKVSDLEAKNIEATEQVLLCYRLLLASVTFNNASDN